jgi:serine/threonine-protein kinase
MPPLYRILGQIGEGQFGQVYCAIDRQTGAMFALKNLDQRRFPTHQFLKELSYLVALTHPNIVTWQGIGYYGRGRYLVMDYCEGGTLRDLLEAQGRLSLKQTLKLITDILLGLSHAHTRQIIHCDIKPENILLTLDSTGWTAKISDFGIARMAETTLPDKKRGGYTGSPAYMAPERFYGKYFYSSDLYAVGVLLYELLAGERPFSGFPAQLMAAHLSQPVSIPETIPLLLHPIIETALRKLPQRRFKDAPEMLQALESATQELTASDSDFYFFLPANSQSSSPKWTIEKSLKLPHSTQQIVIEGSSMYWSMDNYFCCQIYENRKLIQDWKTPLDGKVTKFLIGTAANLVLTTSSEADLSHNCFYAFAPLSPTYGDSICSLPAYHLLSDIDANGQWMATISALRPDSDKGIFQIFHLPNFRGMSPSFISPLPQQLIILDQRHGLAIYTQECDPKTTFKLFNRRGNIVEGYPLSISLKLIIRSLSHPYQLLGIERSNPFLAALIKLKPLKITRIPLDFIPDQIVAQKWGYLLANSQGKVLSLDSRGELLYSIDTGQEITAIAAFSEAKLIVGTPNHLHLINVENYRKHRFSDSY